MTASIASLRKSFENSSVESIGQLLSQHTRTDELLRNVLVALQTSNKLIQRYPNKREQQRREGIFSLLDTFFAGLSLHKLHEVKDMLIVAETGYRHILEDLDALPASQLDPAVKVHAVVFAACDFIRKFRQKAEQNFIKTRIFNQRLELPDGNSVDINAIYEKAGTAVAMTLKMEGYRNQWIGRDGIFILPVCAPPPLEQVEEAHAVLGAAIQWDRWQHTEQRARFLGGQLDIKSTDDIGNVCVTHTPNIDGEKDLIVASERLNLRITQLYLQLCASLEHEYGKGAVKPGSRALGGFLVKSVEELSGLESLSKILAVNPWTDNTEYLGLPLRKLVRAYTALRHLAEKNSHGGCITKSRSGWEHFFSEHGFSSEESQKFIACATFRQSSIDLYDHPFIQLENGHFMLFAPILQSAVISRLVLSNFSSSNVDLHGKGKLFEAAVIKIFHEAGLPCHSRKRVIDDVEYEFDAVVPWDEYLFIFECKNNNLPFGEPSNAMHFEERCQENIQQVQRLVQGLHKHPELLDDLVPDWKQKTLVPVVLNCLPYSRQGATDGVYFYDAQSLERFFDSGVISVTDGVDDIPHPNSPQAHLWSGSEPKGADLMAQIDSPFSHKYLTDMLNETAAHYSIGSKWKVFDTELVLEGYDKLVFTRD